MLQSQRICGDRSRITIRRAGKILISGKYFGPAVALRPSPLFPLPSSLNVAPELLIAISDDKKYGGSHV